MLRASLSFFILGIVCMIFGINNIAGLSVDIGKVLLVIFCVLSVISFFIGKSSRRSFVSIALVAILGGLVSDQVRADDSIKETAKEVANDTRRAGREAVRVTQDKTCPMIKGKMECAGQKVQNQMQKAGDKIEDAVD